MHKKVIGNTKPKIRTRYFEKNKQQTAGTAAKWT